LCLCFTLWDMKIVIHRAYFGWVTNLYFKYGKGYCSMAQNKVVQKMTAPLWLHICRICVLVPVRRSCYFPWVCCWVQVAAKVKWICLETLSSCNMIFVHMEKCMGTIQPGQSWTCCTSFPEEPNSPTLHTFQIWYRKVQTCGNLRGPMLTKSTGTMGGCHTCTAQHTMWHYLQYVCKP
jgi:hypothetical protein